MHMGFDFGLTVPTESTVGKVDVDASLKQRLPQVCHRFTLSYGISGHQCRANGGSFHQIRRLFIPTGNMVQIACVFPARESRIYIVFCAEPIIRAPTNGGLPMM